jgi:tRNA (guanine37-N1)-methyltransferase
VLLTVLTLFPEALSAYVNASILGIAQEKGLVEIRLVDFRDFARDRHRTVDDRPFGGGPGMVLKPEPILDCVEWLERRDGPFHKVLLTPAGAPFRQGDARRLAREERILLLAGRYEGVDERVCLLAEWEYISIGDFVLAGGELPALCVVEAVARLVPGVLGDERSCEQESFEAGGGLEHPHYTRPRTFRGREVPSVLLSGDHGAIETWRRRESERRTRARRPDLSSQPNHEKEAGPNGTANER